MKILHINESLYRLIEHIHAGGSLEEFMVKNPVMNSENILKVMLMLVNGGYLKLERVAAKHFPSVSIVVPVRDDPGNLQECLKSLENLKYPKDRYEIIVIDDGSQKAVALPGIRVIRNDVSQGPAACRNAGASQAGGDILAFIDADCVAGENWLNELVPFFKAAGTGAVGGYVGGYHQKTTLDRYENAFSSLNMGSRYLMEAKSSSTFYVPTANLLVSRDAFKKAGGFNEKMRVGEDVDFCWRMRDSGLTLIYAPFGKVAHKHRNKLWLMLKRIFEYGTSEALLYQAHQEKKKSFSISLFTGLAFLSLVLAILLLNAYLLAALPAVLLTDLMLKFTSKLKNDSFSFSRIPVPLLRSYLSFFYYAFFHLVRYYLILVILLGFLWHPLWILGSLALLYASGVDYAMKRPALFYPVFFFYYLLEQLAYQIGVAWGCVKYRYFRGYLLRFKRP